MSTVQCIGTDEVSVALPLQYCDFIHSHKTFLLLGLLQLKKKFEPKRLLNKKGAQTWKNVNS